MTTSPGDLRTSDISGNGHEPTDPLSDWGSRRPWYKRWPLWAVVVTAVVAASVISDLPQHSTQQDRVSTDAAVVKEIATGLHTCEFAVSQSFSIYREYSLGTFPSSDRSLVPRYLSDDQQACTFANQAIYGISTITVPNSPAGSDLSSVITTTLEWATSDGVGAIDDIAVLVDHPHQAATLKDLAKRERMLASDRALAERQLDAAKRSLGGAPLPSLGLPRLPTPVQGVTTSRRQ